MSEEEFVKDMFHNAKEVALPKNTDSTITNNSKNKMQSVLFPVYSAVQGLPLNQISKTSAEIFSPLFRVDMILGFTITADALRTRLSQNVGRVCQVTPVS